MLKAKRERYITFLNLIYAIKIQTGRNLTFVTRDFLLPEFLETLILTNEVNFMIKFNLFIERLNKVQSFLGRINLVDSCISDIFNFAKWKKKFQNRSKKNNSERSLLDIESDEDYIVTSSEGDWTLKKGTMIESVTSIARAEGIDCLQTLLPLVKGSEPKHWAKLKGWAVIEKNGKNSIKRKKEIHFYGCSMNGLMYKFKVNEPKK